MRLLIVRVGAMGDVLHALPAVTALRRARPDWTIDWVVDERWRPLLAGEHTPVVNGAYAVSTRDWKQHPLAPRTLRSFLEFRHLRESYDLVVDMQGTLRSAAIAWLAGRGRLAGYADPREAPARRLYTRAVERRGTHVVEQSAALLGEATGVALTPTTAEIALDRRIEESVERGYTFRRPLAMLAPAAGWGAKQWPADRFGELARQLKARGFDVTVNAHRADDPLAGEVLAASAGTAQVSAGNVAELIALMRRTDLFIGGDSGPMHLAAALAVPTVALFGPTSPERNGPWGPGPTRVLRDPLSATTYKRTAETDPGLARISVEQVLAAINELQQNPAG